VSSAFDVVAVSVPVFALLGAVLWVRRRREPGAVMALVYLAETLVYPYINERRTVLVLPVLLAFYLVGAHEVLRWLTAGLGRWVPRDALLRGLAAVGALLLIVPLAWQLDRNYRFDAGEHTSRPLGSPYLRFAAAVTGPGDVLETGYVWTTSLGTGRRTANSAFLAPCDAEAIKAAARKDGAGFVVDAAFNTRPPVTDCTNRILAAAPWAVPLYSSRLDDGVVYELVGRGTAHPGLADAVTEDGVPGEADGGSAQTWQWSRPRRLTQLSLSAAGPVSGVATGVRIEWSDAAGAWHTAATATGAVGSEDATPFLLWRPDTPVTATGVRIVVHGGSGIRTQQLHALTVGEQ
jgi:hypothetical protein